MEGPPGLPCHLSSALSPKPTPKPETQCSPCRLSPCPRSVNPQVLASHVSQGHLLFTPAHITTHKTSVHSSHLSALWATSHAHLRPGHSSRSETQLGCRISGSGGEAAGTDHQALPSGRASLPRGPTLDMRAHHDEHTIKDSASQDPAKDDRRCLPTGGSCSSRATFLPLREGGPDQHVREGSRQVSCGPT